MTQSRRKGSVMEVGAHVRVNAALDGWGEALDRYGTVEKVSSGDLRAFVSTQIHSGWVRLEDLTRVG